MRLASRLFGYLAIFVLGLAMLAPLRAAASATFIFDQANSTESTSVPKAAKAGTSRQQLAAASREAAGEQQDETAQFKHSDSVRWLSKITGLSLQHAYMLAVGLNFAVIAGAIFWFSKKGLPGVFRARTASIQQAVQEARKTSEEARSRLSDIEKRLSQLGSEISEMRASAEREAGAEEERIKAATAEDAKRIVEAAEQEITAAAKAARRELTKHAADLAVSLAQKQIHVDTATDQRLLHNFAQQLSNGNHPKGQD